MHTMARRINHSQSSKKDPEEPDAFEPELIEPEESLPLDLGSWKESEFNDSKDPEDESRDFEDPDADEPKDAEESQEGFAVVVTGTPTSGVVVTGST